MPKPKRPRRGSLQFWPRKRAKRIYPRIKFPRDDKARPLGFAGYKVGMLHAEIVEDNKLKVKAATVLACAPLFVCGIRFYTRDWKGDLVAIGETWTSNYPKELERKIGKWSKLPSFDFEANKDKVKEVRLIVCTFPQRAGMHKLKPELFEIPIGGEVEEQYEYAKSVLGKEIDVSEVFRPGEYCDVTAITKGKGFAGVVARFGVKEKRPKEKKTRRHTGSIGPTTPRRVMWQVPMPGQMGFHQRTEYNKRILAIIENGKELTPSSGWLGYGVIKDAKALIIEGSVPGPRKRLVFITLPRRGKKYKPVEIKQFVLPVKS